MRKELRGPRQSKKLSQVFLKVRWPAERTMDQLRQWGVRKVLEVGPGAGALTIPLLEEGFEVTAIEKDERFAAEVKRLAAAYAPQAFERLKVINEDILTFNVPEWLRQNPGAAVVGNIPYQISSPLVLQTLKFLSLSKGAIFLTQLEFARRLASASGSKEYGSISVYAQLRADVKLLATVERELFSPVPNVDSAIVAMEPLKETLSDADLARVEKVCRISFSQRRKQLANSLKPFLKDRNRDASPVDLSLRPEVLSPDKFYELSRFVFPTE